MPVLMSSPTWDWLVVGLLCLTVEALGIGGFLLGSAASAFLLALLGWFFPTLTWPWQWIIFALGSFTLSVLYWKLFRRINETSDHPHLNQRAAQLMGQTLRLTHALPAGIGKIQIGDTLWSVQSPVDLAQESLVIITAVIGMTLILEPCDADQATRLHHHVDV